MASLPIKNSISPLEIYFRWTFIISVGDQNLIIMRTIYIPTLMV